MELQWAWELKARRSIQRLDQPKVTFSHDLLVAAPSYYNKRLDPEASFLQVLIELRDGSTACLHLGIYSYRN